MARLLETPLPIERIDPLFVPDNLSGVNGTNRADQNDCGIRASTDLEAIQSFLANKTQGSGSQQTFRAYRKECERLLLWSWMEAGIPMSSLKVDDIQEYRKFLADPQPAEYWVGTTNSREKADWRPFQGPLSEESRIYANKILASLFGYLQKTQYIKKNVVDLAGPIRKEEEQHKDTMKAFDSDRYFPVRLWAEIERSLDALSTETAKLAMRSARLRFIIYAYYLTGCRLTELTSATMSQFSCKEGPDGISRWWLKIHGKGRLEREIPVHDLIPELVRYRKARGLPPYPRKNETSVPLISRIHNPNEAVTGSVVDKEIRPFFTGLAERLEDDYPEGADRLRRASAHWMRHSRASHALADGASLLSVSRHLGHSDLKVTSGYLHEEELVQYEEMKRPPKA